MDEEWAELIKEIGAVVEASGRMLKRKPPLSKQDLTDIATTLTMSTKTLRIARDGIFK